MAFLAIDWGTTNRRVFRIEHGVVVATERDDRGASSLSPADYPEEVAGIRARMGDLPVLMAGMVGSTIGWREAPYVAAPAGLGDLAASLERIDDRTAIVPGVAVRDAANPDVMRGEEVQLLGAVEAGMVPPDALLCQPGTHCKWVRMVNGRIAGFDTAMTGELFAMLRLHGILAPQLKAPVTDGEPFREGVRRGADRDLAAALFKIRAAKVLGYRDDADAASYASGLLIGADVATRLDGTPVAILADAALGSLYAAAMETLGGTSTLVDSHQAFVAGIIRIRELQP
ncbi:2-dehydro-3-deoxygalactonokinase [Sphingomonas sp. Y38-1Y]|uniref:2-dehydro-3-deoxygalactonokinase n=1 Tax=Sphingomonas sp. Y38-1Y TaxID=3078265 RepID=UPI0028E8D762|nr:2-dehydro-3-deoxygalactonokinase [Sphingomonas sp. Y38-1Y]